MATINNEVLEKIRDQIVGLLKDNRDSLNEAYILADKERLSIALSSSVEPTKEPRQVKVKTTISFTKEKVKDDAVDYVEVDQMSLFEENNQFDLEVSNE